MTVTLDSRTDVPPGLLDTLTRCPEKAEQYVLDPYFRHGARELAAEFVLPRTFVVLKPDAIAGRRLDVVIDLVRRNGFRIVAGTTFRFTPLLTREIWRYQFNIASADRAEIVDLLLPAGDSVLLIVEDDRYRAGGLPAACRLSGLKGSADPGARRPDDLRSVLKGPTTLFNFIHTADEPADVVRELALLEVATGQRILRLGAVDETALVRRAYDSMPAHDLDERASWQRLGDSDNHAVAALAQLALAGDPAADWSALLDLFPGRVPPAESLWDALSIATAQIASNVPGLTPIVPTVGPSLWRSAAGSGGR
jgi:hypothetical protein